MNWAFSLQLEQKRISATYLCGLPLRLVFSGDRRDKKLKKIHTFLGKRAKLISHYLAFRF